MRTYKILHAPEGYCDDTDCLICGWDNLKAIYWEARERDEVHKLPIDILGRIAERTGSELAILNNGKAVRFMKRRIGYGIERAETKGEGKL